MSTPIGENAFLHELELNVSTELVMAGTSQPEEEAVNVSLDEWLFDPADAQRYEIGLHNLLGAVEALEDGPGRVPPRGTLSRPVRHYQRRADQPAGRKPVAHDVRPGPVSAGPG